MGRPEPCVLYAHTFAHPHLDEYVDEVLFSEPVYVTACEFLEQNATSLCPAVKLIGATSPPSFALEVFIQCGGEARFRRLCMPCLYSQSSSNVLEVEAGLTNHLVVRGSYRSLSMVIYGNTAEDLGQFNIEVGLDSSLTDTVGALEGNLEDLPPAFRPTKMAIDELVSPLEILFQPVVALDVRVGLRHFLQFFLTTLDSQDLGVAADNAIKSLLSVASTYAMPRTSEKVVEPNQLSLDMSASSEDSDHILSEARKELLCLDVNKKLNDAFEDPSKCSTQSLFLESKAYVSTSQELVDALLQRFDFVNSARSVGYPHLSQHKNTIVWLSIARLLCSAKESCFHFVNRGGMKQLGYVFSNRLQNSTSLVSLLLGVIEQATRHSTGCEGFLGWWPRKDDSIPSGVSDGYNQLLRLLLENQRHDVASLATYILHRLRIYEVACRYEGAVLSVLGGISKAGQAANFTLDVLANVQMQLKKLLKLLKLCGPIDDPSPVASARRFHTLGDTGLLAYKSTSYLVNRSNCRFLNWGIDSHLLTLLKERGFLPLTAALLSSSILLSEAAPAIDLFVDIVSYIEEILLSLLFCRSGLYFLLHDPEVFSTIIHALRGIKDVPKEASISLRYASVLTSKGFFCHPREVGINIEMHARALIAVDSLCKLKPDTEEFLWVLWDLCRLSRSESGRQALLVLVNIPEALAVLMTALNSGREVDPASPSTGVSPLNLAIFHSAAEIFEVIVTDSTASSLASWIDHGKKLHIALHSSSPGSTNKDAPARLLEWIDASVVYHRNGAAGVLRYAAVLASGGDANMASNSTLASDMMDLDDAVGDSSNGPDGNIVDNLIGKRITEKDFAGFILRDSTVAQLTTAFRILAFISDDPVVAAALYDEGAVMVIHAIMINCKLMLERSSNIYDYLVDEGTESNSTSDLLLERNREKSLIDLLIPSLVLLINLLQKLEEAKEQHRNTKLMDTLLQLHREVSPKLAACAAVISYSCPDFELGLGAACHLLASVLAFWPVYSWTPGLFHFLLESLHTTSLLALGPKETCSLLCILNYLFPDESFSLWKNGMPMLSGLRALAAGTLLGSQKEKQINWYLRPGRPEKLVAQLTPHLAKLGEVVLHCAISMSGVIQDMLRIFIIRIAYLSIDNAYILMKPIILWISHCLSEPSPLSDIDAYKVQRLLTFISLLFEHPIAKPLLLKDGGFQMLTKVLDRCLRAANSHLNHSTGNINLPNDEVSLLSWCAPLFKLISLLIDNRASLPRAGLYCRGIPERCSAKECSILWSYLLGFCKILPVGRELLACLAALSEMCSSTEGRSALLSIHEYSEADINNLIDASRNIINASEWKEHPPLSSCWTNLMRSIDRNTAPAIHIAEAIHKLVLMVFGFCVEGESLNLDRVAVIKFLFGVQNENSLQNFVEESLDHVEELSDSLGPDTNIHRTSSQVKEAAKLLMLLLQKSSEVEEVDATIASGYISLHPPLSSSRIQKIADRSRIEDQNLDDEFEERFSWECPENLRERLAQTAKRKMPQMEGPNSRRARGDNPAADPTAGQSRGSSVLAVGTPLGPTRRDNFRQRKPNTSRPPSMHVDDYVARERNADVISVQRTGSGRAPSIHVDEFMARQRGSSSQNVADPAAALVKTTVAGSEDAADKSNEAKVLKPALDDDLDIVFDAEESDEADDKLPFPQTDDNLQQPTSVVESIHSVVEESGSDANDINQLGTPLASVMDENTPAEISSRNSASRSDIPLKREPSISSERKLLPEESKSFPMRTPPNAIDPVGPAAPGYMNNQSVRYPRPTPNLYPKINLQQTGSHGFNDRKFPSSQPPLPPMPPPATVLVQNVAPSSFHAQQEYVVSSSTVRTSLSSPSRPPPPLPPTPPPYSTTSFMNTSSSISPQYFQTVNNNSVHQQTLTPPKIDSRSQMSSYSGQSYFRPSSGPTGASNLYSNYPDNMQNVSLSTLQHSPTLPQFHRPPAQHPRQTAHVASQASPANVYHQTQEQRTVSHSLQQHTDPSRVNLHLTGIGSTSQEQDPAMSLQEYFKSPEAIQSLLSDRDKLCQLLEQHPKLMQMLQARLGHM